MYRKNIQQQIVSHFWSESLKAHIAQTHYEFHDEELISLIWWYVPEYQERIRLFGLMEETIPEIAEQANQCIRILESSFDKFKLGSDGEVFELRIIEPESPEERYLCDNFETAMRMIDMFWVEYDFAHESPETKYTIVKRSILHAADDFREDELGRCELGPGKVMLSAEMSDLYDWKQFPDLSDIRFPSFIPNLTIVKFRHCGETLLGIVFEPNRDDLYDSIYVIPLDGCVEPDWWDHHHISLPNVDIVSEETLSTQQKEAAATLRVFLRNWMAQHKSDAHLIAK